MKNTHAQSLGKLALGVPKQLSDSDRLARAKRMRAINRKRANLEKENQFLLKALRTISDICCGEAQCKQEARAALKR